MSNAATSCIEDPALLAGNRKPLAGYQASHFLWEGRRRARNHRSAGPTQAICMLTEDFTRAYEAFVAKSKPRFEGN